MNWNKQLHPNEPATKWCKECNQKKSSLAFEYNQNNLGKIARRGDCKECRNKKKKFKSAPFKKIKEYVARHPRPQAGDEFECPICERTITLNSNKMVNLDHDHETGKIRGYLCNYCNTGMGRLDDDIERLKRCISWISGTL